MAKRIDRDIEAQADLYPPSTYAQLLSFFKDIGLDYDAKGSDFISLTGARSNRGPRGTILFAIGVIPPSADVTGRALDRSATVATQLDDAFGAEANTGANAATQTAAGDGPGPQGRSVGAHRAARQIVMEAGEEVLGRPLTMAELQYVQAVAFLETGYGNGWKKGMVGSNNWGAVHCSKREEGLDRFLGVSAGSFGINIGTTRVSFGNCIEHEDTRPDGSSYKQTFKTYATPKDGAKDVVKHVLTQRSTGKALGSDGSIYGASFIMRREKYYGGRCPQAVKQYGATAAQQSVGTPDKNEGTQACEREAVEAHAKRVQEVINDIATSNGDATKPPLGSYEDAKNRFGPKANESKDGAVVGDTGNGTWKDDGSANANAASKSTAKTAGTSLNNTDRGRQLQMAQARYAAMLRDAIERLKSTPPLKMLVNPASFSVKGEKIVQDGNWGRNGPIIEHWGDNQDMISASGKLAGFFAIDKLNAGGPGLTRYARNYSESWKNFQSLFLLYKNNAAIYLPEVDGRPVNLAMLGSIYIYYDNILYIGSFNSLSLTEDASKPFSMEYSFEFTVRASFVLDRTDDEFTYGAPSLMSQLGSAPVSGRPTGTTNDTPTANVGGKDVAPSDMEIFTSWANDEPQTPSDMEIFTAWANDERSQ